MVHNFTPTLIEDIKHNRTANIRGGKENNISLDLLNEFYNAQTKGKSTQSIENYRENINRSGLDLHELLYY